MTSKVDTKTFKLTNFSPIGFKVVNYPVQFCSLCRGYLSEVCNTCTERKSEVCNVINSEGSYYHNHCYQFMNSTSKTKVKPKKYMSDSE